MNIIQKIITCLAVVCLSLSTVNAQQNKNSLLWKIEGENIETSYIFGTLHMLSKDDFLLKDSVKEAFELAEVLVMELDMDDPNMQAEAMKVSFLGEDDRLNNHLDAEEVKILEAYLKKNVGVGLQQVEKIKPVALSSMIMMKFLGEEMASYEFTFLSMAAQQKKEIMGLETLTEQMSLFDNISYEDQLDDIMKMINDTNGVDDFFKTITEIYKKENIEGLYQSLYSLFEYDEATMERILDDRNKRWVPQIGDYSKEKKVFYAVGSGHLGGENGVVNLLRNAGYTVTPVTE